MFKRLWWKWRQFLLTLLSRPQLRLCVAHHFNSRQIFHNLCLGRLWKASVGEERAHSWCDESLSVGVSEFSSQDVKPLHGFRFPASRWNFVPLRKLSTGQKCQSEIGIDGIVVHSRILVKSPATLRVMGSSFVTSNPCLPTSDLRWRVHLFFNPPPVEAYHRNHDVGRLGVTSNVHGNDLKNTSFVWSKFGITEVLAGAPRSLFRPSRLPVSCRLLLRRFGTWEQHGSAKNSTVRFIDDALEGSRMQRKFPTVCVVFPGDFNKAYKQVPAEPSLASFAGMVQWHPQKRCSAFLVGRTQFFFWWKSCPVNFASVPDWCCHALAT